MFYLETRTNPNHKLEHLRLQNKALGIHATIYPNLGASIQTFKMNDIPILDGISADESGITDYYIKFQSSLLFPFFGRIPEGRYAHDETVYHLDCNGDQGTTAIHGLIYDQEFVLDSCALTAEEAQLQFSYNAARKRKGFPFPYTIRLTYTFSAKGLALTLVINNTGPSSLPFGLGWHPYFRTPNLSSCKIMFSADSQLILNEKLVPEGIGNVQCSLPLVIGDQELDHGFLLGESSFTLETDAYKCAVDFSSESPNSYLQLYTPPHRRSIAIEPLTCAPNCFNNGLGLQILEPHETYSWQANLKVETKKNH